MEKQIKVVIFMSTTLRHIYVFGKQKVQEQATSKDSGAIYIYDEDSFETDNTVYSSTRA